MIAAVTGQEVPPPPGLPIDVGAVVCNVSTTVAVYDAVQKNKPLIERVVTVTGRQMEAPKNLLVRFERRWLSCWRLREACRPGM